MSQTCQTVCDPMNYTVHGILQTRILEWVAFPFSRRSSKPRDQTQVSPIACRFYLSHQGSPIIKYAWCLLFGRKAMTNLDSIIKSRDITLPTKAHLVKAMVFPVVMYGYESWTIKKAEHWRIDAFKLWCWRRLLWVPWTASRSNQSILKKISPGCVHW